VLRIDGPDELDPDALGDARVVGVTAGASAPEDLVQAVIERLAPTDGVETVHVTDEDEYFPPPRELRALQERERQRSSSARREQDRDRHRVEEGVGDDAGTQPLVAPAEATE
jgi:hypothetical protein